MPKWEQTGTGAVLARTARKSLIKEVIFEQSLEGCERAAKERSGNSVPIRGNSEGQSWEEVGKSLAYSGWPGWMAVSKGRTEGGKIASKHGTSQGMVGSPWRVASYAHLLLYRAPVTNQHCSRPGVEHKEKLTFQGWRQIIHKELNKRSRKS